MAILIEKIDVLVISTDAGCHNYIIVKNPAIFREMIFCFVM